MSFTARRAGAAPQQHRIIGIPAGAESPGRGAQSFTARASPATYGAAMTPAHQHQQQQPSAAVLGTSPSFAPDTLISSPFNTATGLGTSGVSAAAAGSGPSGAMRGGSGTCNAVAQVPG